MKKLCLLLALAVPVLAFGQEKSSAKDEILAKVASQYAIITGIDYNRAWVVIDSLYQANGSPRLEWVDEASKFSRAHYRPYPDRIWIGNEDILGDFVAEIAHVVQMRDRRIWTTRKIASHQIKIWWSMATTNASFQEAHDTHVYKRDSRDYEFDCHEKYERALRAHLRLSMPQYKWKER